MVLPSQIYAYFLTRSFPNTIFASYITFLCSLTLPHPNLLPLITHFKSFTCILPPSLNLLQGSSNTLKEISVPSTKIFSNFDPYFLCSLTRQYHSASSKLPSSASPKPCALHQNSQSHKPALFPDTTKHPKYAENAFQRAHTPHAE